MVSIVIPTYNRCDHVLAAARSVLAQTYASWELFIVDDGSEDGTADAVQTLRDPRVRYVRQSHRGVSAARNAGIRLAERPWLAFLDSDDRWLPTKLERQLNELERRPEYHVIYTDEIWIRRGIRVNPGKKHAKHSGWIYPRCLPLCIISPSSVLLSRDVLETCGTFDESYPVCEDYELWLRIAQRYPIRFLEEPLIIKTGGHADQLSHSIWGMDRYRVRALIERCESGRLTPLLYRWTAEEITRKATILAKGFANRGNGEQARKYRDMAVAWEAAAQAADSPKGSSDRGTGSQPPNTGRATA
jgi:glycosyltransferase involved in cell wall biosynthesis